MRVLFDQATPVPIRSHLDQHEVRTVAQEGWDRLKNGELLAAAEAAGFEVLLTTDKNIRYQQNLSGRKIAIVVLGQQQWPKLRVHIPLVVEGVNAAIPGSYIEVNFPIEPKREARTEKLTAVLGRIQTRRSFPFRDKIFSKRLVISIWRV